MNNKLSILLLSSLLMATSISSMVDAGNVKKKYINVSKEGEQATANDLGNILTHYGAITPSLSTFVHDYKNGNEGVFKNGVQKIQDSSQGAVISLNGTNQSVYVDDKKNLLNTITGNITLESWAYLDVSSYPYTTAPNLISESDNLAYRWRVNNNGTLWFLLNDGAGYELYTTPTTITFPLQSWHHTAVTTDFSTHQVKFYLDGKLIYTTATSKNSIAKVTPKFHIGSYAGYSTELWKGKLKEVRVWNIARSDSDILSHYNKSLQGNEKGLVGYWKMD